MCGPVVLSVTLAVVAAPPVLAATRARVPVETAAALELSRQCLGQPGEAGIETCRRALGIGLARGREALIRQTLTARLAGLKRWEEVVALHLDAVRLDPQDPVAHRRLGSALLYLVGRPAEAAVALRESVRLDPASAEAQGTLGVALAAMGQPQDAVAALEEAVRLDPEYLDRRPASRQVLDAAQRGQTWPDLPR
jgi:tetratricopeptide (TPR) repeat protein